MWVPLLCVRRKGSFLGVQENPLGCRENPPKSKPNWRFVDCKLKVQIAMAENKTLRCVGKKKRGNYFMHPIKLLLSPIQMLPENTFRKKKNLCFLEKYFRNFIVF